MSAALTSSRRVSDWRWGSFPLDIAVSLCGVMLVLLATVELTLGFTVPVAFVAVRVVLVPGTTTVAADDDVEGDVELEVGSSTVAETSASRQVHLWGCIVQSYIVKQSQATRLCAPGTTK